MQTIYKYHLQITDIQTIKMPANATILSVADQCGELCLWALVDTEMPDAKRNIERFVEVIGTGNRMPIGIGIERKFIGTVLMSPFVWHVFERV